MDPLSDVLRAVRLTGAFFFKVEASEPWSVASPDPRDLRPRVLPGADHLMSYHILVEGRAYASGHASGPIELRPGDVLVFPHGDPHAVSSDARRLRHPDPLDVEIARYPETMHLGAGAQTDATFVCGFLGCDRRPFNPLLTGLPRVLRVRGLRDGWLRAFSTQVVEESTRRNAGMATVLTRLAELMFIEVLRHHVADQARETTGWLAGLADPVVGAALTRLHAQPTRDWTLATLASEVATSRSVLAERFTRLVGQPPMHYLAAWRMQLAAALLSDGASKVAGVAAAVGYDSEAAFSRAFKKATGHAPGAWRVRSGEHPAVVPPSLALVP